MDAKVIREQAIREAKTGLILNAARKVFADRGFPEARLEDIAVAAGFSKAALYSYYSDKEEIFLSLAIRDLEKLRDRLADVIIPGLSFLKNLKAMLKATFEFFGENFAMLLSVANFQSTCNFSRENIPEKHRQLFEELPKKFQHILDQQVMLLKEARERGEITSPIDDVQLANYLSALVRGVIFQWKLCGRMGNAAQEIHHLLAFIAFGLGCSASEASAVTPE